MFRCKSWQAVTALLLVLLLPWLVSGWKCIRQESRLHFNIFMGCSVLYASHISSPIPRADHRLLAGWSASFSHELFRLEFITWPFFGTLGTLGAVLTVSSIVLAVLRRTTFDRGLADYLKFDMVSDTKVPVATQNKVEPLVLPATSLPTFSSAFPSGPAPPPVCHVSRHQISSVLMIASNVPGDCADCRTARSQHTILATGRRLACRATLTDPSLRFIMHQSASFR